MDGGLFEGLQHLSGLTRVRVCIPARWASERLPGKLSKPWREGTVLAATVAVGASLGAGPVVVATDDDRIARLAAHAGAVLARTSTAPRNGTERVAEALAAGALGRPEIVINLQGDAVGASRAVLEAAIGALDHADLATVAVRSWDPDPHGRTTVTVRAGFAVDFSRAPLPPGDVPGARLLHIGVYAYRPDSLIEAAAMPMSDRERAESLEQLRWLAGGRKIAIAILDGPTSLAHAVDVRADLDLQT
jgi:3-deoxy-manno-octulosonate cytidylyltransferase (CMP-KDO synthetase)